MSVGSVAKPKNWFGGLFLSRRKPHEDNQIPFLEAGNLTEHEFTGVRGSSNSICLGLKLNLEECIELVITSTPAPITDINSIWILQITDMSETTMQRMRALPIGITAVLAATFCASPEQVAILQSNIRGDFFIWHMPPKQIEYMDVMDFVSIVRYAYVVFVLHAEGF